MNRLFPALLLTAVVFMTSTEARASLLDNDPEVVYMERYTDEPVELVIIKEAPIYSDKEGKRKLGSVKKGQQVQLQAMSEKAYRVSAKVGGGNKVRGWVAPWAFTSDDPDFIANLKALYEREIVVQQLLAEQRAAIGMTIDEVGLALGKPTKTTMRKTAEGTTGKWEFITYEDVDQY